MTVIAGRPTLLSRTWSGHLSVFLILLCVGVAGFTLYHDELAFMSRVFATALLVLSLDLVVGYCGVATLGQAALYGGPAYVAGALAVNAGLDDPIAMLAVGGLAGAVAGLVSGMLIGRFRGLPQLVLSIALGQLVEAFANKAVWLTGGTDGLSGITPRPVFGLVPFDIYGTTCYVLSFCVLALAFFGLRAFVNSPFGLICRCIRDDELRVRMMGIQVYPRLVATYVVSGLVAGLGGALTAIDAGVVSLESVGFERSAEALVMLVVGGAGHLWGALIGCLVFQLAEHYLDAGNPFQWMMIVGALLIAVVMFFPGGIWKSALILAGRFDRRPA